MLQIQNKSPFATRVDVFPNKEGVDTLYVVVKGTFYLYPRVALAENQLEPFPADKYFGDPETSSLKYASEAHLGKVGTDVVLVGSAWPPNEAQVPQMFVSVAVAERRKVIRVVGDRVWTGARGFTTPQPFKTIPLVYERAFGGVHRLGDNATQVLAEERNPVGIGFMGNRSAAEMRGGRLPNLEHPDQPIEKPGDRAPPAAFGFIAASWLPRRTYAGTYDEAWKKQRMPYLPRDFQQRFFNAASPDLAFDRFLKGGEPVSIIGASKAGPLNFNVPSCDLEVSVRISGSVTTTPMYLETLLIEPDENRLCLSWRGEQICDKRVLKVEEVLVGLAGVAPMKGA